MFDEYTDDDLVKLRWRYATAFSSRSPFDMINRGHFFECLKEVDEELTKRGVLVNEED